MKRNIGYAIALLTLATGLSAPLPAQQPTPEKSDLIDSSAMDALNQMGTYLRSLKDFQVKANVTSEDVLEDGEKLTFAHTTDMLAVRPNKLRIDIQGDQKSRLVLYDGKTFTLFARACGLLRICGRTPNYRSIDRHCARQVRHGASPRGSLPVGRAAGLY